MKTSGPAGAAVACMSGSISESPLRLKSLLRWPLASTVGALVLLFIGSSPPQPALGPVEPELTPVVDGASQFTLDLYSRLRTQGGNLCISPLSIYSALAVAYGGAYGNTERQMAQALHVPADRLGFHRTLGQLTSTLTNNADAKGVNLHLATSLWPQQDYQLTGDSLALCRLTYAAEVHFLDFKSGYRSAGQRIASWVEHQTKGKIKELFAPGTLTAETRLVIVNAIYFKGPWASRFDKSKTHAKPFWVVPDKSTPVPMMSQKSAFRQLAEGELQILELPYRGHGLSMLVLLPKSPSLEKKTNEGKRLG